MHAWWDNSPSATCWGTKGGFQSYCSNYGTVVVKVDLVNHADYTVHKNDSEKYRYENCVTDTNSVSCCIDKSDLCVKNQAEADDNDKIKYFKSGNSTLQTASVGTTYRALRVLPGQSGHDLLRARSRRRRAQSRLHRERLQLALEPERRRPSA